jgi:putative chitinase
MIVLSADAIARCTGARADRAQNRAQSLNEAMALYGIDTARRQAMFLANIGHETAGLKYLRELWGPTAQQLRYERDFTAPWPASAQEAKLPRFAKNRLAYNLGNYVKGDGERFRGHGDFQTTGRYNHAATRDRLRKRFPNMVVPDFEKDPEALATPEWAAISAGDYVARNKLNEVADTGSFDNYCDIINRGRLTEDLGDSNGWEHRLALYEVALPLLEFLHG